MILMNSVIRQLTAYEQDLLADDLRTEFKRLGEKTVVCLLTTKYGFEIVGSAAPIDKSIFKEEIGMLYSLKNALSKYDEFRGFLMHERANKEVIKGEVGLERFWDDGE